MRTLVATITRRVQETPEVVSVYFTLYDGSVLPYAAGQYITVYFERSSTPEGKAYSLSSAPHEPEMCITVKVIGEFSRKIAALQVGETMMISEAYGYFGPISAEPLICFTAGVGISPVWSIIKDLAEHSDPRPITLYCSNKTTKTIPFKDMLEQQLRKQPQLTLTHHITRDHFVPCSMEIGRIPFANAAKTETEPFYLLCGHDDFVRSAWRELRKIGVNADHISTETFFAS